jgi:polar amino acid transport system substrate-binding protein
MIFACLFGCKDHKDPQNQTKNHKKETVVVATCADNPPFSYHRLGRMTGFEIDLFDKIAKELNFKLEWKDLAFDALLESVQSGKVDCAISAIAENDKRKSVMDFSIPYHDSKVAMIVTKDSNFQKVDDLKDELIGTQIGSSHEAILEGMLPNGKIQTLPKMPELLAALKNSQIKALVTGAIEASDQVKNEDKLAYFIIPNKVELFAIAFPKGSKLLEKINGVIKKFQDNGVISELEKKYFKEPLFQR